MSKNKISSFDKGLLLWWKSISFFKIFLYWRFKSELDYWVNVKVVKNSSFHTSSLIWKCCWIMTYYTKASALSVVYLIQYITKSAHICDVLWNRRNGLIFTPFLWHFVFATLLKKWIAALKLYFWNGIYFWNWMNHEGHDAPLSKFLM